MNTWNPCPKPTSKERKEQRSAKQKSLKSYRSDQVSLAILRDGGFCAICWFRDGVKRPYAEVHHVYGRAVVSGDWWREDCENLLCVCKSCHPLPIQTPGGSKALGWVEIILEKASKTPLNPDFSTHKD
jgi:hypothetical protein